MPVFSSSLCLLVFFFLPKVIRSFLWNLCDAEGRARKIRGLLEKRTFTFGDVRGSLPLKELLPADETLFVRSEDTLALFLFSVEL